jgi:hypothetical protein
MPFLQYSTMAKLISIINKNGIGRYAAVEDIVTNEA